jgi:hypothetical protein
MAVDYDAPRRNTEDEEHESLEEVKAAAGSSKTAQSPDVEEDEAVAAENFELPGADLSHEELAVEVKPMQSDEFTCTICFLVHHRAALTSEPGHPAVCRDCA